MYTVSYKIQKQTCEHVRPEVLQIIMLTNTKAKEMDHA